MSIKKIKIVSRRSNLALRQSAIVQEALMRVQPNLQVEIIGISTSGDEILDQPLNKIGGKGLFVSELENYLLENAADLAVHSMKDMPAAMPPELQIGAILKRADPRDVFVSKHFTNILELPAGSIVGTSSLRRQAQVLALNNKVTVRALRGNVETRLQKLIADEYTAIILAAAGLERLGLTQWLQNRLEPLYMLPAVGQGAIGIQYNQANVELKTLLERLNDPATAACVHAERAMNAVLDGGCQAPIAGYATLQDGVITLQGLVADPDAARILKYTQSDVVAAAADLGTRVAKNLIDQGALEIIAKAKQDQKNSW